MGEIRLQKLLSECGVASRRKAEEMIARGQVKVNGHVAGVGDKADPKKDIVTVEGRRIARPERLFIRLSTTKSVKSMSAKPTTKVEMRLTPRVPAGPLTTSSPNTLGLSKAMCTRPLSTETYRQLMTLRMISPNASVTMAR